MEKKQESREVAGSIKVDKSLLHQAKQNNFDVFDIKYDAVGWHYFASEAYKNDISLNNIDSFSDVIFFNVLIKEISKLIYFIIILIFNINKFFHKLFFKIFKN